MPKQKSLAVIPEGGFAITVDEQAATSVGEVLTSNGIRPFDLGKLTVPPGGGTSWEIDTLEGSVSEKTIDVVIGAVRSGRRQWWRLDMNDPDRDGNSPPECQSMDGITGQGVNSMTDDTVGEHSCQECQWSQWGSARNGSGSDCRQGALLLVFREASRLPDVLNLSVTSLNNLRKYAVKLAGEGLQAHQVITQLGLEQAASKTGIKYSRVTFQYVRAMDPDERALVERTHADLDEYLTNSRS